MPTYASIVPTAETDGVPYCTAVPVTSTEADLGDGLLSPAPIPIPFGQFISAIVQLSVNGYITANNTYVIMQSDYGDGVWVDVCWAKMTQSQGTATFAFVGRASGSNNSGFQLTRQVGQDPGVTGANASVSLGGRVRFVGKSNMAGGSSSAGGVTTQITATIRYKLTGLR